MGSADPSGTAAGGERPTGCLACTPLTLPGRFPYVRPCTSRCNAWDDEYCGTRFRSPRREARSIGTRPSNPASLPQRAGGWPIGRMRIPRGHPGSNTAPPPSARSPSGCGPPEYHTLQKSPPRACRTGRPARRRFLEHAEAFLEDRGWLAVPSGERTPSGVPRPPSPTAAHASSTTVRTCALARRSGDRYVTAGVLRRATAVQRARRSAPPWSGP